ncbi:MAG TPA: bifunctional hydroxymethylpyrimidine kinase/phosphomethylpyrimidine kinase [Candidatus Caldiarchaeum subterraneum]|uniref:Bifunctional hydroxymethylpyrimidine kinase/phosphomethylpyrimidine kinase n=1 Tax=Caldiarchaeum subterraneum TaxID=311458 RepID=A0A833A350_CALS0|nr:bifunctional hydroxymethylpyrimidine kinase/phosphomethylpyrimidine kinase [Candidatus Caldarchaeum subterraneum]
MVPRALTVAGSDSGGGAGIQADLKTFAALGVHGMSAITSITAQNTVEVTAIHDIPVDLVKEQIRVVVRDIGVDAVKTGMLHTSEVIEAVAEELSKLNTPIVVDPVAVAKSGARLIEEEAIATLSEKLIPLATVVTPNTAEATALTGLEVKTLEDQMQAAKILAQKAKAAVVKGGHVSSRNVVDVLCIGGEKFVFFEGRRIETRNTHGTGCVFASAIAAALAKGMALEDAVRLAKDFVTEAIVNGVEVGAGHGPVNPVAKVVKNSSMLEAVKHLRTALDLLEQDPHVHLLVPESQINVAEAPEGASSPGEVAAVPGRVVKVGDRVKRVSDPWFGASRHVAKAVLTAMKHSAYVKSAMNIRNTPTIIAAAADLGLSVAMYDRSREPPEIKRVEGMTIPWGVEEAVKTHGSVPDVIYHNGDMGKEPMALVFGSDAVDVVKKVLKIAERYASITGSAGEG